MENTKTWLLVADASKARLFTLQKARLFQDNYPKHLELIGSYTHNDSRKKGSDLSSDRMGEFGTGTFVEATSPKFHEAEQFAHELIAALHTGHTENSFRDIIIVAPPAFMGLLHKHMPHAIQKLISQTIEKDYTQDNEQQLLQNLLQHF